MYFWQNTYRGTLVPQHLQPLSLSHLALYLLSTLICHYFCKMLYLKCLAVFWIHLYLHNCAVICTVTLFYVLHRRIHNSDIFSTLVYTAICRHIQQFSASLRHIDAYWDIIMVYSGLNQAYPAHCLTLPYSQSCHILSTGIFWIEPKAYLKTLWSVDQAYSEPCHRVLFSYIQECSEPCPTLAYAEIWHTQNPEIFRTLTLLHPYVYTEPCHINENLHIFIFINYNYFSKVL